MKKVLIVLLLTITNIGFSQGNLTAKDSIIIVNAKLAAIRTNKYYQEKIVNIRNMDNIYAIIDTLKRNSVKRSKVNYLIKKQKKK